MKLPTLSALLMGALVPNVQAACSENNCYRALFPTQSPAYLPTASSFCSSLLATPTSSPGGGYPTRATSACGTANPSKYSSVCSCKVTVATPTPTPTCPPPGGDYPNSDGMVHNGGFECTSVNSVTPYYPWEPQLAPGTEWSLSPNGNTDGPGNTPGTAFEFRQTGPAAPDAHNAQARLLQTVYGPTGLPAASYTLFFSTWITGSGFWGVPLPGGGGITVDAFDAKGPGVWNHWNVTYTSNGGIDLIFEVITNEVGSVFRIDDVYIKKN